jgi:hypothetical protein
VPFCATATSHVYPHKYVSLDKPGVSVLIQRLVFMHPCGNGLSLLFCNSSETPVCIVFLQRRHMDESGHMAADGRFGVHLLRANPQLAERCRIRPRCTG